ncbi:MAG: hypothetical protein ABFS12_17760 [Bacteroidota bacterium]
MKKTLSIIGFIFLLCFAFCQPDKEGKKKINNNIITQNFEVASKIDQIRQKHGKLKSHKFIDDTLLYKRVEADFYEDQILSEDEIELSVRYAFMPQMYHDKAIKLPINRRIVLKGNFFFNKQLGNKIYRTINYIVSSNGEGGILINKTFDISENINKVKLPNRLINKLILVSSSIYDNKSKVKFHLNHQIRFSVLNNTLYWTFKDVKSSKPYSLEPTILKGINLQFKLKEDGTIDSLVNYLAIINELKDRIDTANKNLINRYPNEIDIINKYTKEIIKSIGNREHLEMTIGRDAFMYFKVGSIGIEKYKKLNIENIEEYPYSKLPIITKSNVNLVDVYSDNTSHYRLTSSINYEMIKDVDSILNITGFQELVKRMEYMREVEYYINKSNIPYFISELSVLKDGKSTNQRQTRIELIR